MGESQPFRRVGRQPGGRVARGAVGVCVLGLLGTLILCGADWPQFRGPGGSGVSSETGLPTSWSGTENLVWKLALPGPGSSSPVTWGDSVFVTCYTGYTEEGGDPADLKRHLLRIDKHRGTLLWTATLETGPAVDRLSGFMTEHGYASSTPVTDGERVYVFYGKSGVLAYDMEGKQLWQTSVGTGSAMNRWGSGTSPILHGDLVIVNANAESETIVALNKLTGKQVWSAKAGGAYGSWATPALVTNPAGKAELIFNVPYELWSLNPEDGKLNWYAEATGRGPVNPTPVSHEGVIYALGSRGVPCAAIRSGGDDDASKNVVWRSEGPNSYVTSPVVYGDHLYFVNDTGVAYCLALADGKEVYGQRLPLGGGRNAYYASVVAGDGKLYAVSRRSGTYVLEAGSECKVLAHNRFEGDDSDFNASPAISDGRLYLRSNRFLYCVGKP